MKSSTAIQFVKFFLNFFSATPQLLICSIIRYYADRIIYGVAMNQQVTINQRALLLTIALTSGSVQYNCWASKMRALIYFTIALTISAHFGVARAQSTDEVATPNAATGSGVGFKTVAEALETLKNTPGVNINYTKPDNWVIITEPGGNTIWSFTPQQHYAYPAVVKRELRVRPDGGVYIEMRALCQAEKSACDKLFEEFKQLNNRSREAVQQKLKQGSGQ